ncbi:probable peptidoglycan muropeptide transporter SLC46 [Planococcus citri]|uniref:probable peptidoglycan muropeptide transporter SLC46 n=1 Tax=Planococcus citri TaxID=170843 RepID=UPI0031F94C27
MSKSKNFASFFKMITVEPTFLLYWAVYVIIDATNTNLLLQKKCRLSAISEPDLNTACDDEKKGVLFATEMNSFYRFLMLFICKFCAVFAVSWSDLAGRRRRPLILLPVIGQIIQAMFGCLHSYFWYWDPLTAMLSNIVIEMMTGGITLIIFGAQMYVCDVSSMESRTMRLGFLSATRTLADLLGYGGSGFILRSIGFFYTYLVCFTVSVISLILALALVKNISTPVDEKPRILDVFNVMKIVDSFKLIFKKSLGHKRMIVFVLLVIYTSVFFTTQGENGILYLFLRYKFHWDERKYSSYVFYRYIGVIMGSIFCSVVLSKILKVHDGIIGVFAGLFDTIAVLGYLFANQNWHLYIVPLFDIFHGTALSVSLSFMSKNYESHELGRLNSVIGIFGLIVPACHPIYNGIFEKTLDVFPSAFFLLSISLDTIVVFLYCVTYYVSRKLEIREKVITEEEEKQMLDRNDSID